MTCSGTDVAPLTQARARPSDLANQGEADAEGIITKNGERRVTPIDADRLGDHHRLERECIHRLLIDDAQRGLADVTAGRTFGADEAIGQRQQRRTAAGKVPALAAPRKAAPEQRG